MLEKIIKVDGKDVKFKANAAVMYRYKTSFGREYLADASEFQKKAQTTGELDYEFLCNLLWVLAKTADNNIPPVAEWLDGFNDFPAWEIYVQLADLLNKNLKVDRKNA